MDGLLAVSRTLVATAARSLAELSDEVTLGQYRVLVILASDGRSERLISPNSSM